jgi:hypothetical protein
LERQEVSPLRGLPCFPFPDPALTSLCRNWHLKFTGEFWHEGVCRIISHTHRIKLNYYPPM